ncbi:MAG: hypothetical protein RR131_07135 [Anaerovorax sp.]
MEGKQELKGVKRCDIFALENAGLKGTASSVSVLKLLEDEEKAREECATEIKKS